MEKVVSTGDMVLYDTGSGIRPAVVVDVLDVAFGRVDLTVFLKDTDLWISGAQGFLLPVTNVYFSVNPSFNCWSWKY